MHHLPNRETATPDSSPPRKRRRMLKWALGIPCGALLALGAIALWITLTAPETISYRGQEIPVVKELEVNRYDPTHFVPNEQGWITYQDDSRTAVTGIDVSFYQGEIDWQAVAESGVEFAIIRLGYRGYATGALQTDSTFQQNLEGALQAGLDVGVYFFSQATSVLEAEEEADYVLEAIRGYPIRYPVVFDWEFIHTEDGARTDHVDGDTVTQCARAFCDLVKVAGYTPALYLNLEMGYLFYDLGELADVSFWLADYQPAPSFYYDFSMWQYSSQGTVPGIQGNVDMNLYFPAWQS